MAGFQRELTRNKKVDAALNNEFMTRQRVEALERDVIRVRERLGKLAQEYQDLSSGNLWCRLRWLWSGRAPSVLASPPS